jgi:hypothetical protein
VTESGRKKQNQKKYHPSHTQKTVSFSFIKNKHGGKNVPVLVQNEMRKWDTAIMFNISKGPNHNN